MSSETSQKDLVKIGKAIDLVTAFDQQIYALDCMFIEQELDCYSNGHAKQPSRSYFAPRPVQAIGPQGSGQPSVEQLARQ